MEPVPKKQKEEQVVTFWYAGGVAQAVRTHLTHIYFSLLFRHWTWIDSLFSYNAMTSSIVLQDPSQTSGLHATLKLYTNNRNIQCLNDIEYNHYLQFIARLDREVSGHAERSSQVDLTDTSEGAAEEKKDDVEDGASLLVDLAAHLPKQLSPIVPLQERPRYKQLVEYIEQHKSLPHATEPLYKFLTNNRSKCPRLQEIWDTYSQKYPDKTEQWNTRFRQLQEYIEQHKARPNSGPCSNLFKSQSKSATVEQLALIAEWRKLPLISQLPPTPEKEEEEWKTNMDALHAYVNANNCLPKADSTLHSWLARQLRNNKDPFRLTTLLLIKQKYTRQRKRKISSI